jgi:hypothetical protein
MLLRFHVDIDFFIGWHRFNIYLEGRTPASSDHLYIGLSPRPCLFLAGTEDVALKGEDCTADFIVIPNPSQKGSLIHADRFCGNALLPTTSKFPVIYTKYSENI